jgi:hypothetical protein
LYIAGLFKVQFLSNSFCSVSAESDFKGYREMANTEEKKIYMVDSGLSFNLPFPILLRLLPMQQQ